MGKQSMNELLKKRMASTKQASELAAGDEAYQKIFREAPPPSPVTIRELPLDLLDPFTTADIGFKPYPDHKLQAFAEQLQAEGLLVKIIVRPKENGRYEILAGHNRAGAAKLAGWTKIAAEIVEVDDARAIVIATSTNLIQRQELSIVERGKAYKALLEAKNRNGQRHASWDTFGDNRQRSKGECIDTSFGECRQSLSESTSAETSVDSRQKYSARALVAEFFGVTEYEIRKLVKLTNLVPELLDIIENNPRQLNLACADLIADYDQSSQDAFVEMARDYNCRFTKAEMEYIVSKCPPPTAEKHLIFATWQELRAAAEQKKLTPPKNITFNRKRFEPYLEKIGGDEKLEELFLEFLRERLG